MQPSETMRQVSFAPLLRASEGLTQWRPMALGFLTWVAVALLLAVGGFLSSSLGGAAGGGLMGLFGLLAMILIAAGMSGAGILLMDKAKNIAPRSMLDAFLAGLWCIPKFLGFYVVMALVLAALAVVGAIGYFLAKIPGIGPLFFFVLHPVLVIVAAAVLTSLLWVGFPLFTPAVWEGRGFKESLTLVIAVSRQRLVPTVLLFLALYVVVSVIGMVVFGALLPGYFFMTGLATSILGVGMTGDGLAAITNLMNGYGGGYNSGLMYAGILATALIFGLAVILMMQVALMGVNLVYLSATDGLDTADTENALNAGLDEMKRRAREAQEKARLAAEQAQEKARQMAEEAKERARQRAAEQAAAQAAAAEQAAAQAQAQAAAVLAAEQAEQQAAADRLATEAAAAQAAPPDAPPQEPTFLAEPAPSTNLPPAPAATATCPQCQHTVGHDDMFCGECGHRLKS